MLSLIMFFIFLLLSAIFSSSETAIFSLNRMWIESIDRKNTSFSLFVLKLVYTNKWVGLWMLNSILAGNTLVNVGATVISGYYIDVVGRSLNLPSLVVFLMDIVGMTFILLVIGEITPKYYAIRHNKKFSVFIAPFIFIVSIPLTLISFVGIILSFILEKIIDKFSKKKTDVLADEVIEESVRQGMIEDWEAKVFRGIVKYDDIKCEEIMTNRSDMVYLYSGSTIRDVQKLLNKYEYTRYPVFDHGREDRVKGILHVKDMVPYLSQPNKRIDDILRPPVFVPEQISGDKLMKVFKNENTHIAIVIDEYGGVSGIVTLDDLLYSIIGIVEKKIHHTFIKEIKPGRKWLVDGDTPIEDVEKTIGMDLPDVEYDTIGGFVYDQINKEVKMGDRFEYGKFVFIVSSVTKRKIEKITIERKR